MKMMKMMRTKKAICVSMVTLIAAGLLSGCGNQTAASGTEIPTDEKEVVSSGDDTEITVSQEEEGTQENSELQAPFFTKGVYSSNDEGADQNGYFYVFYDENSGYTEDEDSMGGEPFSCEQSDDKVMFSFGGIEETSRKELIVKSADNGRITGEFDKDGVEIVFELLSDEDPDNFKAVNYVLKAGGSEEAVYDDANGWRVRYIASDFEITTKAPVTTFVYTGESSGTNMITVTYVVTDDAETYISKLAESWEIENAAITKGIFPGTKDVDSYSVSIPPAEDGSGLWESAIARDYMDGSLVFEITGHNSGDEKDAQVAEELSAIIDSIEFLEW